MDIEKYSALEALAASPAGKILIEGNLKDIVTGVTVLTSNFMTLQHSEFIAISAEMKTKMDMVLSLARAGTNRDDAEKALEEVLFDS